MKTTCVTCHKLSQTVSQVLMPIDKFK